MPAFRACTKCNKNGVDRDEKGKSIPCPICLADSKLIGQAGWAFPATINSYYNNLAAKAAEARVAAQLEIYKQANPDASNSSIKDRKKKLTALIMAQELTQYKDKMVVEDDERKHRW